MTKYKFKKLKYFSPQEPYSGGLTFLARIKNEYF